MGSFPRVSRLGAQETIQKAREAFERALTTPKAETSGFKTPARRPRGRRGPPRAAGATAGCVGGGHFARHFGALTGFRDPETFHWGSTWLGYLLSWFRGSVRGCFFWEDSLGIAIFLFVILLEQNN